MLEETFFAFVRGQSESIPNGYSRQGMQLYRHLVYVGVSQMLDESFPGLQKELGAVQWRYLIASFIRQSAWTSHFYADLKEEFTTFLAQQISDTSAP